MKTNLRTFSRDAFEQIKAAMKDVREFIAYHNEATPYSWLPPKSAVFFVAKRITDQGLNRSLYDWCFVIESTTRESVHARAFFFVSGTGDQRRIQFASKCHACGVFTEPCSHTRGLIYKAADQDDPASKCYGVFNNNDWGLRDPDIRTAEWDIDQEMQVFDPLVTLQQFAKQVKPKKAWPDGQEVVLQIDSGHVTNEDNLNLAIVTLLCRTSEGELLGVDPAKFQLPPEEDQWHHRALAMGGVRSERAHYPARASDGVSIIAFARAGRLYSHKGDRIKYAGGTAAILGWVPSETEGQRIEPKMDRPWFWMRGDAGPVLDANRMSIADTEFSPKQLESLLLLPELGDEAAEQIRREWADNPRLAETLLPLAPSSRTIEIRNLAWSGVVSTMKTDNGSRVVITAQLLDGDVAVSPDIKNGQLVQIEGDLWYRYVVPNQIASLRELLQATEFNPVQTEGRIVYIGPPGCTMSHVALMLPLLDDCSWITLPEEVNAEMLLPKVARSCAVSCQVAESGRKKASSYDASDPDKQLPPYELVISINAEGQSVSPKNLIAHQAGSHYAFQNGLCRLFGADISHRVVEVQAGKFAILKEASIYATQGTLERLLDHARPIGNRYFLTEGALLRLATTTRLPIEDGPILQRARDKVQKLLAAQGDAEEMVIEGIDGITFSPKQASGVRWLVTLLEEGLGGILADKRGAGKTFQSLGAIALSRSWRAKNKKGPAIVMMELKELDHWVLKHLVDHCSGLKWEVFHGNHKPTDEVLLQADLVVTTYGVFQRHAERFRALNPTFVFADEAKRLKNRQSKTTKEIQTLVNASIISINGTPLYKNIGDTWTSFNLASPGFLGSSTNFASTYRRNADSQDYLDTLRQAMAPLFIRRDIDNGRGMPEKTLIPQFITMDASQIEAYEAARQRVLAQMEAMKGTMTAPQMRFKLRLLLDRLREITASPGNTKKLTSKGETIREMVSEFVEEGHQVLVFSHSNTYVDAIAEILRSEGIPTSVYRGSNAKERNREKDLFKNGHSRVLVLSDLGAKGLDLPEASRVIITDPWIDADEDDQMADRARRFVSTKDLEVFHLICVGTLEEGAMEIQARNRAQEQAILEGAPAPAPSKGLKATTDDYDYLLSFTPSPGANE